MNDDITKQILQKHVESGERETRGGVSESELNGLLCDFKEAMKKGFMVCESSPNGNHQVRITTHNLKDAQKLHRILINICNT